MSPADRTPRCPRPRRARAWMRRGAAVTLCAGAWAVAAFLAFDAADRWLGRRPAELPLTGALVFPTALLAVAAALALTVWVARSWGAMKGEGPPSSGS